MPARRKIMKIVVCSIMGLIVVAYLFLFFRFNSYKPSKIKYEIVPEALNDFHETYLDRRVQRG